MKKKYSGNINCVLFAAIFCLLLYSPICNAQSNESLQAKNFYDFLKTISSLSKAEQIDSLEQYVVSHPLHPEPFWILLNHYWAYGVTDSSLSFFQQLEQKPTHQTFARWCVAILNATQGDSLESVRYLTTLLQSDQSFSIFFFRFFMNYISDEWDISTFPKLFAPRLKKLSKENRTLILAFIKRAEGKYEASNQLLKELSSETSRHPLVQLLYARNLIWLKDFTRAIPLIDSLLTEAREHGDEFYEMLFLNTIGNAARFQRNRSKELEAYEKAYQIAQQIKAVYTGHLIARNLVDALIRDGKYKEAINLALKNIPLARNIGTDNHRAYLLYASGQAYYYLEQLHNTQAAYDAAQKIWEKKKHVYYPNLIRVMFTQGDIYLQMYLTRLAQFRYQQGLQLAKRFQSKKSILIGYQRLGKLYYEMEDYPKAIEYFLLYKNNTTRPYYLCYANDMLGACYLKLKDYQKSREYYRAAYEISKNLSDLYHAYIAVDWAKINLYSGNMDEASEYYQEALNIADSFSSREEEVNELYVLIYNGMGEISLAAEDIPGAIGNFRRAVKYVEAGREALKVEDFRIGYFSEEVKIYNRLANCYFRLYQEQHRTEYVDSLYWFLEMARGRTLKDIPQQKSGLNLWGESPQVQRYKEISHKLEKLQRKLRIGNSQYLSPEAKDSLLTQIELVRYELVEAKLRMLKEAGDVSSNYIVKPLGDIQNDLEGMKAAVLLYQIGQEESYVLVVTSDHVQVVPLTITQKALETKISQLINPFHQISSHDIQKIPFYASIAHELYQKLFFPIEQAMNLPENLFVVPDFTMTNLPLEILLTEPPRQEIYTPLDNPDYTGHFLVHRYIFSYTPTVVLIKPRSKFPLRKPRVAVFANPVDSRKYLAQMPAQPSVPGKETTPGGRTTSRMRDGIIIDRHFSPLIFAEVEGEKIQKIYPPTNIYFRDEFNTEIFKKVAEDYDVIHLATHGFVETSFDAFSGLVMGLSNQETDDGFLMGYEIAELSLDDCELITLSACETGQGEIKAGEGVLGLPRLFLVAGVKTVLMTLWKVDDQFTAQLMPEFYEYLFKKDATKARALSLAKRNLLKSKKSSNNLYYQHPLFWASFVLYGDPGLSSLVPSYKKIFLVLVVPGIIVILLVVIITRKFYFRKFGKSTN